MDDLPDPQVVLDAIPDPPTCRALLARAIRHAAIFRKLISISERKHIASKPTKNNRGEDTHAR